MFKKKQLFDKKNMTGQEGMMLYISPEFRRVLIPSGKSSNVASSSTHKDQKSLFKAALWPQRKHGMSQQ